MAFQRTSLLIALVKKCSSVHRQASRSVAVVRNFSVTSQNNQYCKSKQIVQSGSLTCRLPFVHNMGYLTIIQRQSEPHLKWGGVMMAQVGRFSQKTTSSDDNRGELVYVGTMSRLVKFVKLFSLSTSAVGIAFQPLIYNQVADLHWALAIAVGGMASFFVFITPLLLHLVSKRYVTQMYWNPETGQFNAVTYSFLLQELQHCFNAKQVTIPNTPHLFTTILINNSKKPLFIDPNLFLNRRALVHLLKYNEPLEWELPSQEGPSSYWDDREAEKMSTKTLQEQEDKPLNKKQAASQHK